MLSEEPFANQRLDMKYENDDYIISDYVSQHFGITVVETMKFHTCHATKPPNIFNDFSFISALEKISQKVKRMRSISHEKMTHWARAVLQ